jgi:hypothetical protein
MSQQSYWRIARTPAMHEQVLAIARAEGRSLSSTLKRLIAEALDYRRIANRQTADEEMRKLKVMIAVAESAENKPASDVIESTRKRADAAAA